MFLVFKKFCNTIFPFIYNIQDDNVYNPFGKEGYQSIYLSQSELSWERKYFIDFPFYFIKGINIKNLNNCIENYRDLYANDKLYLSIINEYEEVFIKKYFNIFALYDYKDEEIQYIMIVKNEDLIIFKYDENAKIMDLYKSFLNHYNTYEKYRHEKSITIKYYDFNDEGKLEYKSKIFYLYVYNTNIQTEILEKITPYFIAKLLNIKSKIEYIPSYLNESFRIFKYENEYFIVNTIGLIRNINDTKNWYFDKDINKLVMRDENKILILDAENGEYQKSFENNIDFNEYRKALIEKSEIFDF